MEEYKFNISDEITVNAKVVDITQAGNLIIKIPSGNKFLIKKSDVNTVHPIQEISDIDMRKGN